MKILIIPALIAVISINLFSEESGLKVHTIDPVALESVKNKIINGEIFYTESLAKLKEEADKYKRQDIHTVVEKNQLPPGGDIHDYLSLAVYYWPDPSKKDGLPYIIKDGETNPETGSVSDKKYLVNFISGTFTLSLAYYLIGNVSYAKKAVEYLDAWFVDEKTMMNPNLEYAQIIKGKNGGNHSGIIDGRDIIKIIDSIGLLSGYKPFDEQSKPKIKSWFNKYLIWLLESQNGMRESVSKNNHLTCYYSQVISITYFLGLKDKAALYAGLTKKLVESQIEPDGSQPLELKRTKAVSYGVFNLKALFILANQVRPLDIDIWNYSSPDGRGIKKALDFIIPYAAGEESSDFKQIVEFNAKELCPLLINAYHIYGNESYMKLAETIGGKDILSIKEILFYVK